MIVGVIEDIFQQAPCTEIRHPNIYLLVEPKPRNRPTVYNFKANFQ